VRVGNRIALAREVVDRLPTALTAFSAGQLTLRHVQLLVDAVIPLDDTAAAAVETAAVPFAAGRDVAAFARKVRREALKADPRTAEQQREVALQQRRVWASPDDHGMSLVGAVLPAEGAQALLAGLDVLADRAPTSGDTRTPDQRRADALVQLGIDALNGYATCPNCATRLSTSGPVHGSAPRWQGLRPTVQVTVALSTLLGVDEQPGELDGYGPIPAALARRLAADPTGTWRRLVTDPVGRLVDYGRTRYRPPADLAEFVLARDRTCRFPTCNRAACRCEIDHVNAWADGGQTNEPNLLVLCCRHHHGKHEAGWRPTLNEDRSVSWTSPLGQTCTVPPATYPVDTTFAMYVAADDSSEQSRLGESPGSGRFTSDDNRQDPRSDLPVSAAA
jgi:hypothetical protein